MLFSTSVHALYHSINNSNLSCVLFISSNLPHQAATILSFSINCSVSPASVVLITSTAFLYTNMLHNESDVVVFPSDTGSIDA